MTLGPIIPVAGGGTRELVNGWLRRHHYLGDAGVDHGAVLYHGTGSAPPYAHRSRDSSVFWRPNFTWTATGDLPSWSTEPPTRNEASDPDAPSFAWGATPSLRHANGRGSLRRA